MIKCPQCSSVWVDAVVQAAPMREYRPGDETVPVQVFRDCQCLRCGNAWSQAGTAPVEPPNTVVTGGSSRL